MNNITVLSDAAAFAAVVVDKIKNLTNPLICLSGGSTIPPVIKALAAEHGSELPEKLRWTWNDERLVPYSHEGSNFGAVNAYIPKGDLFPLPPEDSADAAATYCRELASNKTPSIDLLILGFGDDGHIASLFPGTDALDSTQEFPWIVRNTASYEPKERWSWTMPALQNAQKTLVLYKGAAEGAKAEHLKNAIEDPACDTPLARFLRGTGGQVEFFRLES